MNFIKINTIIIKMYNHALKDSLTFIKLKSDLENVIEDLLKRIEAFKNKELSEMCEKIIYENNFLDSLINKQSQTTNNLKKELNIFILNQEFDYVNILFVDKDEIIKSIDIANNLFIIAKEIIEYMFSLYSQFTFEKENNITISSKFKKENDYLHNFFEIIQLNRIFKFEKIKENQKKIKVENESFFENILLFLANFRILRNYNQKFENNSVILTDKLHIFNFYRDKKYATILYDIEKFTANEELYYQNISLIDINEFETTFLNIFKSFCSKLEMEIQQYIVTQEIFVKEVHDEIYKNAIFKNIQRKKQMHLELFERRVVIFFDYYLFIEESMFIYYEITINNNYLVTFNEKGINMISNIICIRNKIFHPDIYDFHNKIKSYFKRLYYSGILSKNKSKLIFLSNFD